MSVVSNKTIVNDENIHLQDEIIQIIFNAYTLVKYNLGIGHSESIYHKALFYELSLHNLSMDSERNLNVQYIDSKGHKHIVGSERIDIFIHHNVSHMKDNIILELKAIPRSFSDKDIFQITKYFRELKKENTTYQCGILINFNQSNSKNEDNFIIVN